jgi:hypothetical protein
MYCSVLYCSVLYCTVLYSTLHYRTVHPKLSLDVPHVLRIANRLPTSYRLINLFYNISPLLTLQCSPLSVTLYLPTAHSPVQSTVCHTVSRHCTLSSAVHCLSHCISPLHTLQCSPLSVTLYLPTAHSPVQSTVCYTVSCRNLLSV